MVTGEKVAEGGMAGPRRAVGGRIKEEVEDRSQPRAGDIYREHSSPRRVSSKLIPFVFGWAGGGVRQIHP